MPSTASCPGSRLLPGCLGALCFAIFASAERASAQVPDTVAVADTLAEPADSVFPPPQLPQLAFPEIERRPVGVWYWDRDALLSTGAVSLLDLLAGMPGVTPLRAGMFLQPEAAALYGGAGGRIEVDLDGFVLDPLASSALDLATIELAQLTEVLVERRLGLLRIRLRTTAPVDARPQSSVEAGIGQPDANLFRGIFLAPRVLVGPLGLAVERLDTDGVGGREPADAFAGWVKWGWLTSERGIQLELRRTTIERDPGSPWPEVWKRQDMVLRARNAFGPALFGEVYAGRSDLEIVATIDSLAVPDSLRPPPVDRSSVQLGARGRWSAERGWAEVALRTRSHASLPRFEAEIGGGAFLGLLALRADLALASWRAGASTSSWELRADAGPFLGISPYAALSGGTRGAPLFAGDVAAAPLRGERSAFRLGTSLRFRGASAGGGLLRVDSDSVPVFGLPFDSAARHLPGGAATGWEVSGRIPLVRDWLAFQGGYLRWASGTRWPYLPADEGRAAIELHAIPLASGNLELIASVEALRRGAMVAPAPVVESEAVSLEPLPPYTLFNAYLQIRILDVRIFLRSDDMTGANPEFLPGRVVPGPRIFYGVKWNFWN